MSIISLIPVDNMLLFFRAIQQRIWLRRLASILIGRCIYRKSSIFCNVISHQLQRYDIQNSCKIIENALFKFKSRNTSNRNTKSTQASLFSPILCSLPCRQSTVLGTNIDWSSPTNLRKAMSESSHINIGLPPRDVICCSTLAHFYMNKNRILIRMQYGWPVINFLWYETFDTTFNQTWYVASFETTAKIGVPPSTSPSGPCFSSPAKIAKV